MAELSVLHIAESILQQLSSPAKDEFLLWFNSTTELKKLELTIKTIRDVLLDAEEKKTGNTEIVGWLSRLNDEIYKADDLFDTISTRALRKQVIPGSRFKKEMKIFFSKSNQIVAFVKTAHKVKELRESLDGIAKDINQFGLGMVTQRDQKPTIKRVPQHSFIPNDEVIGRDKEKEELLRLLMADVGAEDRVSVIAIVGIGGQGKTALAQLLYNAKEIQDLFDLRLWACVHDFSNLKEALEEILATKTGSLDELQYRLRAKINGKKFLLVVDDVCDDIREQWLHLKRLLDVGERGSMIIMTTRSKTVAQNLATVKPHYDLGELSDKDAWALFKRMAFDSNNEDENQTKEELGRLIMNKFPKVPLAIRAVGSFLRSKDKKQWSKFVDNGLMKGMPDDVNLVMKVLKISYEDLPLSIKNCFAYCSLFPKDYQFDKTTLIYLWMAQGFLELSKENPCLEDAGESYFLHLVQRCFFQDVKVGQDGDIINCKMHDLFHDLAVQVASSECLTMLNMTDDLARKSPRHLLVKEVTGSPLECKGVRSLVTPNTGFVERSLLDGVFLNLTSLRTLSLRQLEMEEMPSSIGKLLHLRYLDLMYSKRLIMLPDALCKLHNLLVLRLEGCLNLIKLPDKLQQMISLRCLQIEGCEKLDHLPSGLEKITSLVSLDRLIVHKEHGGLRCLKLLDNLTGKIGIELPAGGWKNCVVDAEESKLSNKTKLSSLSMRWCYGSQVEELPEADVVLYKLRPSNSLSHLSVDGYSGVKFPNWLSSLHNLVELTLVSCRRCHELPQLRHLSHLKNLLLCSLPLVEYTENDMCYDNGPFFPSLKSLEIVELGGLKGWWRQAGKDCVFPRLSHLVVYDCPQLSSIPSCPFVENLSLTDVSVDLVKQLLASCNILHRLTLHEINGLTILPEEFQSLSFVRRLSINRCCSFKRSSLFHLLQRLPLLERLNFRKYDDSELTSTAKIGLIWSQLTRLKELEFEFGSDKVGAHLLNQLHHLTNLERLFIYGNVPNDEEDTEWTAPPNLVQLLVQDLTEVAGLNRVIRQLKNLQHLTIRSSGIIDEHELNKLPWEDLTSLRNLHFVHANSMRSLPNKCQDLIALEDLQISHCREIASLPDWISRLTSLEIMGCPGLKEKCRKPVGSCWPLIRNIPYCSIS